MRRILLVLLIVPAVLGLTASPAHALTFIVDTTADDDDGTCLNSPLGDCTLREAINQANLALGLDTITFDIPGTGQHTIAPSSALPSITSPVSIDGFSDPDDPLAPGSSSTARMPERGSSGSSYPAAGMGRRSEVSSSTTSAKGSDLVLAGIRSRATTSERTRPAWSPRATSSGCLFPGQETRSAAAEPVRAT